MSVMKLQNLAILVTLIPYALGSPHLANFPEYRSLAGLSSEEVRAVAQTFSSTPGAQPLPPPVGNTSSKLVYDAAHPFVPDEPGFFRGPCPGMNTLAAHGYLNHNGVVTPDQIITAVQKGFNMGYNLATFITYATFVADGNHLTNLITIGANFTTNGTTIISGMNTHGNFEGDASTTRGDAYFGDNYSFNEALFDQLVTASGGVNGALTLQSVSSQKAQRIKNSIATNPAFTIESPRFLPLHAETTFPLAFFASNQSAGTAASVPIANARSFFQDHKYPVGFVSRQAPYDFPQVTLLVNKVISLVGARPGRNIGGVNKFVVNLQDDGSPCIVYNRQVNLVARLYPNPTGDLRTAIKTNLATFYKTVGNSSCTQLFPYGR